MSVTEAAALEKKKKSKGNKGKILFDEEVITKQVAHNKGFLIKEDEYVNNNMTGTNSNKISISKNKAQRRIKKKRKPDGNNSTAEDVPPAKHKKKSKKKSEVETIPTEEPDLGETEDKKKESIRARKRKKYLKLMEETKLKGELNMQQKCLNYLSLWKHDKSTWKFEKLKQVWLIQNIYDNVKIPDEFWDVMVRYFNNSKGKVKETLLKDALKIVEDNNDEINVKYERARYIVQNLQE